MTRIFLIVLMCVCITGCSLPSFEPTADPTRFYVLGGNNVPGTGGSEPGNETLIIGLRPVLLPDYLNTRKIAVRAQSFEIRYRDYERWGEDLQKAVTRELALKLIQRDPRLLVEYHSLSRPGRLAATLFVDIHRFEVDEQGTFQLQGEWRIENPATGEVLNQQTTFWSVPGWNKSDYSALVGLHNTALGHLADEINDALDARF